MATVSETKPHLTCSPQTRRRISHPQEKCEIWVREVSLVIPKATTRAEDHIPDNANSITLKTKPCFHSSPAKKGPASILRMVNVWECSDQSSSEISTELSTLQGSRGNTPKSHPHRMSLRTGGSARAQTKMHITNKQNPQSES